MAVRAQLGSILSNCLLVLGCAFLLGGIKYTVQRFNRPAAVTNCAMLMLSVMTLMCALTTAEHPHLCLFVHIVSRSH